MVESTPLRRSKRHATTSSRTHQEPEAKRRKIPKRACKEAARKHFEQPATSVPRKRKGEPKDVGPSPNAHPAATFKTPKNPRATFEGLPAELRVLIYEFASQSTMIHVHMHVRQPKPIFGIRDFVNRSMRFSWTPCRGTNPKNPLLCANPKWSGMCKEEDRCTHKLTAPSEPRGFWALVTSNKAIRREAKVPCLRNTVISIDNCELGIWLGYLAIHAPSHMEQIRRITVAGRDLFQIGKFAMDILRKGFPNLEGVGYQCQSPFSYWTREWRSGRWIIPRDAWMDCPNLDWTAFFDPSVDFVFEAIVRRHPRDRLQFELERPEYMTAIRVFAHGTKGVHDIETLALKSLEWETETVECSPLPEPKRNAMWRRWWP